MPSGLPLKRGEIRTYLQGLVYLNYTHEEALHKVLSLCGAFLLSYTGLQLLDN